MSCISIYYSRFKSQANFELNYFLNFQKSFKAFFMKFYREINYEFWNSPNLALTSFLIDYLETDTDLLNQICFLFEKYELELKACSNFLKLITFFGLMELCYQVCI